MTDRQFHTGVQSAQHKTFFQQPIGLQNGGATPYDNSQNFLLPNSLDLLGDSSSDYDPLRNSSNSNSSQTPDSQSSCNLVQTPLGTDNYNYEAILNTIHSTSQTALDSQQTLSNNFDSAIPNSIHSFIPSTNYSLESTNNNFVDPNINNNHYYNNHNNDSLTMMNPSTPSRNQLATSGNYPNSARQRTADAQRSTSSLNCFGNQQEDTDADLIFNDEEEDESEDDYEDESESPENSQPTTPSRRTKKKSTDHVPLYDQPNKNSKLDQIQSAIAQANDPTTCPLYIAAKTFGLEQAALHIINEYSCFYRANLPARVYLNIEHQYKNTNPMTDPSVVCGEYSQISGNLCQMQFRFPAKEKSDYKNITELFRDLRFAQFGERKKQGRERYTVKYKPNDGKEPGWSFTTVHIKSLSEHMRKTYGITVNKFNMVDSSDKFHPPNLRMPTSATTWVTTAANFQFLKNLQDTLYPSVPFPASFQNLEYRSTNDNTNNTNNNNSNNNNNNNHIDQSPSPYYTPSQIKPYTPSVNFFRQDPDNNNNTSALIAQSTAIQEREIQQQVQLNQGTLTRQQYRGPDLPISNSDTRAISRTTLQAATPSEQAALINLKMQMLLNATQVLETESYVNSALAAVSAALDIIIHGNPNDPDSVRTSIMNQLIQSHPESNGEPVSVPRRIQNVIPRTPQSNYGEQGSPSQFDRTTDKPKRFSKKCLPYTIDDSLQETSNKKRKQDDTDE